MIPRDYITELVQRSDIVDVVQSYVQLRHRGRTHTGLCPFHNEKTPSFVVYPETQSFYCFGCGAGGDVITFIKKINNVDYIEAVKFLAGRAGMALPEEDDQTGRLRSRIISINKDAARFYFSRLNSDAGRLAEETDVAKPAILNQLDAAIRARGRRAEKERERRLLEEGAGGRINVPYSQGGQKALGVAFAEQQLVAAILKNPDYIRLAAPRVSGGTFLDAGLGRAYTLLCEKGAKGEYLDLSALSEELPEETVSLISRVLAQNYDIGLSAQDVELYLDRIEHSQPVSSTAGGRTAAELADYLQALKDKKT